MLSSNDNIAFLSPTFSIDTFQVLLFIAGNDDQRSIFIEKITSEGQNQITEISLKGDLRKQDGILSSYRNSSRKAATAKWNEEKTHPNVNAEEANTIKQQFDFFYSANCTTEQADALKNTILAETKPIFLLKVDKYIENKVKEHRGITIQYEPIIHNNSHCCVIS